MVNSALGKIPLQEPYTFQANLNKFRKAPAQKYKSSSQNNRYGQEKKEEVPYLYEYVPKKKKNFVTEENKLNYNHTDSAEFNDHIKARFD